VHCLTTITNFPHDSIHSAPKCSVVFLLRVPHGIPQPSSHNQSHCPQINHNHVNCTHMTSYDDGVAKKSEDLMLRLTPALGSIVRLHHQWDHV
jgi:hypothetical protein